MNLRPSWAAQWVWGQPRYVVTSSLPFYFIFYLYDPSTLLYMCRSIPKSQRRASDPMELQMVVDFNVGAGNWTWVFWKSNQFSYPLSLVSSCIILNSFKSYSAILLWNLGFTTGAMSQIQLLMLNKPIKKAKLKMDDRKEVFLHHDYIEK